MSNSVEQIKEWLRTDKWESAIQLLLENTEKYAWQDLHDEVVVQSNAFYSLKNQIQNRLISHDDYEKKHAQMMVSLQTIFKIYKAKHDILENDLKTLHAQEIQTLQNKIQVLEQEKAELTRNTISQRNGISNFIFTTKKPAKY